MLAVCVVVCTLWLSVQVPVGHAVLCQGPVLQEEVTHTYLPSDAQAHARTIPTRRRRASRALSIRVGRDQAVLRSVLGVHVVDFKAV
jgi:hypothetical protein